MDSGEIDTFSVDSDDLVWITYIKGYTEEPLEDWLKKTKPSSVTRGAGYVWVSVLHDHLKDSGDIKRDREGLYDSFEEMIDSGKTVNFQNIKALALNHNVTSGKWLFFTDSGGKADHLWYIVATNIVNKMLPCYSAKVSTYEDGKKHVICIYNKNFTNQEQVFASEQAIRQMGIKCKLMYKPDVYTLLGIYHNNQWGICPNIMISNYDVIKGSSVIQYLI